MTLVDSVSPPAPELEAPLSPTTSREQRSPMHIWCMTQLLIDRGVEEMKELYELRHEGYQQNTVEAHFQNQKANCQAPSEKLTHGWFLSMKSVLREIDQETSCIPSSGRVRFLDLGCSPGGFACHILSKNPMAQGVGVSLSEDQGGHAFLLDYRLRKRFHLLEEDMLHFDLSPAGTNSTPATKFLPTKLKARSFDIVLLDGHWVWTYAPDGPDSKGQAHPSTGQRLLISQLVIALHTVKRGGTLIMKLKRPEDILTAKLLRILDVLSGKLIAYKPYKHHNTRSSFYVVASGIGLGAQGHTIDDVEAALRRVWLDTLIGGDAGEGRFIHLDHDLGWVLSDEEVKTEYIEKIIELGRPIWQTQVNGLRRLFMRTGVQVSGNHVLSK